MAKLFRVEIDIEKIVSLEAENVDQRFNDDQNDLRV